MEGVGGKETIEGEDRPARAVWLYVTRSVHGSDKSSERLSERPFSASGASCKRLDRTSWNVLVAGC
jgi:hypothetical protein